MDTPHSLLERITHPSSTTAWPRFIELYTPILCHWIRRLGPQSVDAADLLQEVFVILVGELPRFRYDPNRSFRAWLKTILMNSWRKRMRPSPVVLGNVDEMPAESTDIDEIEYRQYLARRALELMQADFEPVTWKSCWETVVNERSAADVARELGTTPNAVYLARGRVLRRLREELLGLLDP